jgi:hypothetical protein
VSQNSLEVIGGKHLESLEKQSREILECYHQNLMGDSGGSPEDQRSCRNVDSKDCTQEVSDEMNPVGNWT